MSDDGEDLGWSDPAVVVGAVALVALIVWVLVWVVTGHNLLRGEQPPHFAVDEQIRRAVRPGDP